MGEFISLPLTAQLAEIERFPQMCDIVDRAFEQMKPAWQGTCRADGKGFDAQMGESRQRKNMSARWGASDESSTIRLYSQDGSYPRNAAQLTLNNGEVSGVQFIDSQALLARKDRNEIKPKAMNFEEPGLLLYVPASSFRKSNIALTDELPLAAATADMQFSAQKLAMVEMQACCSGAEGIDLSRCDQYGIKVAGLQKSATPDKPAAQ